MGLRWEWSGEHTFCEDRGRGSFFALISMQDRHVELSVDALLCKDLICLVSDVYKPGQWHDYRLISSETVVSHDGRACLSDCHVETDPEPVVIKGVRAVSNQHRHSWGVKCWLFV